jgi:hypothetical protein
LAAALGLPIAALETASADEKQSKVPAQGEDLGTSASTKSEGPRERPDVPLIVEQGGVLLKKGHIVIEPSVDFSLVETNRAEVAGFTVLPAILIGNFNISQVARETITAALTARAGITNRLEFEVRIPFVYRNDRETRRPIGSGSSADETININGHGLGDVEFAAHYQINDGSGGLPFFVGNLRAKSDTGKSPFDVNTDASGNPTDLPTGNGFWSLQPSVTMILPTDPAVLFGNINYTWNIPRTIGGFGKIDPGDSFGGSLGIGFALNEKLSLSMAYDHSYVLETKQSGSTTNSPLHIGRALFGGSYRVADKASVNLNVGIGVTEQAPDVSTTLRVPITFQPFD